MSQYMLTLSITHSTNSGSLQELLAYSADVTSANDFYAFGSPMPGRNYSAGAYRYGMNGQEKDDEIFTGAMTAEFWEYDR